MKARKAARAKRGPRRFVSFDYRTEQGRGWALIPVPANVKEPWPWALDHLNECRGNPPIRKVARVKIIEVT